MKLSNFAEDLVLWRKERDVAAENVRLRAAISAWALATYPETRPEMHDIEGRCKAQAALDEAERVLYAIFKEGR